MRFFGSRPNCNRGAVADFPLWACRIRDLICDVAASRRRDVSGTVVTLSTRQPVSASTPTLSHPHIMAEPKAPPSFDTNRIVARVLHEMLSPIRVTPNKSPDLDRVAEVTAVAPRGYIYF